MKTLTGFAAACYDTNSLTELGAALSHGDATDCAVWGITEDQRLIAIMDAILAIKNDELGE